MNKKGFTIIEIIASLSLTLIISLFLFQIIVSLKNIYDQSISKTNIINNQAILSSLINKKIIKSNLNGLEKCGKNCVNFVYADGSKDKFAVNYDEKSIEFGNYKTILIDNTYVKNVSFNIFNSGILDKNNNDSILIIDIPLYNDLFKNKNLGVKIAYQFSSTNSNISAVDFEA